jgi:hypothetical protein
MQKIKSHVVKIILLLVACLVVLFSKPWLFVS